MGHELDSCCVGVVGAGAMGIGIAEVAAAAGHKTLVFDTNLEAANSALAAMKNRLEGRVSRGKITQEAAEEIVKRVSVVSSLAELRDAGLIIEAIVEKLEIKQHVFSELENVVSRETLLTSNTSSISITKIAAALDHPERFAGLHFFNPAPVMKLVEVIAGLQTDPSIVDRLVGLAQRWNKVPARAKSVPGFIVNRVARPFYAEGFLALEQGSATPEKIDAALTRSAGFRMGPMTLTDLIGHDVNLAVAQSVYAAYDGATRFRPSLFQKELVDAGRLGRKTGHGVFTYNDNQGPTVHLHIPSKDTCELKLEVHPAALGLPHAFKNDAANNAVDVIENDSLKNDQFKIGDVLCLPNDGRSAGARASRYGQPVLIFDWSKDPGSSDLLVISRSGEVSQDKLSEITTLFERLGRKTIAFNDRPGLIVLRTIAMLVNAACDAARDQVASELDIDRAMQFGVNYPHGPFEWARIIGPEKLVTVLENISAETGDPIYQPSEYLRAMARSQTQTKVQ